MNSFTTYVFRATYIVEVDDPENLGEVRAREVVPEVIFGGSDHPFGRIEREDIEYEDEYDNEEDRHRPPRSGAARLPHEVAQGVRSL